MAFSPLVHIMMAELPIKLGEAIKVDRCIQSFIPTVILGKLLNHANPQSSHLQEKDVQIIISTPWNSLRTPTHTLVGSL